MTAVHSSTETTGGIQHVCSEPGRLKSYTKGRTVNPFRLSFGLAVAVVSVVLACRVMEVNASLQDSPAREGFIDLTKATVVVPESLSPRERKAVTMLVEEVQKRTMVRWSVSASIPADRTAPVILAGPRNAIQTLLSQQIAVSPDSDKAAARSEGYQIVVSARDAVVTVLGNDERGVLFGVGRLLRELRMNRGHISIPGAFQETSAPETPLRGHQLGYRPKTNSYDAWDLAQWEQYYRDLAVFGTNAIELIPPRSDDDADSPHFPVPPMEMMVDMSRVADEYGLDVWVWYPAMDADYTDPKTVELALREWEEVYRRLPRIDVIFVPGGDPGHTHPQPLMALLEKQASLLRKYHPKAQMWMSPQSFNRDWDDEFYKIMKSEPAWLNGIVFGPQVRMSLFDVRKAIPARYPIRGYPDITHSINCQHPVPEWDTAFALTEGREVINPRPVSQATIFRYYQKATIGFLTYSEGCNDDVNKIVWSGLGWDSRTEVIDILRQYSRYFIADKFTEEFAQGLLSLERNWSGPLLTNVGVETTLQQFQSMEQTGGPRLLQNWRFQQALYRAYYDVVLRDRLISETAQRSRASEILRNASRTGTLAAMQQAESVLDEADTISSTSARRARCNELAEALFQSISMQLNSRLHQGQHGRGTSHDTIDVPLNDRHWLKKQFADIRAIEQEKDRLTALNAVISRTDPGPGSFYDDLGDPDRQPHLAVNTVPFAENPDFRKSVYTSFDFRADRPREWWNNAVSMYDSPLLMHYDGLDPHARYKVRFVYSAEPLRKVKVQLSADGLKLHDLMVKPDEMTPLEFEVPLAATQDGELTLRWNREPGYGGNGRGCQVAEVWLLKQP